ncbi:MAG TPA: phage terminase small subunit P27 family [Ochrobactrum sp.]|nr:phage terminase small subunit P27 family [Ochrobactrum sp.]
MGQRGPQALPPNVLALRGGKPRSKNLADGVQPLVQIPDAPRHLSATAKKEWKRITPLLVEEGLIAMMDRSILALYCQNWGRMVELETALAKKIDLKVAEGMEYNDAVEHCCYDWTPKGYRQQAAIVSMIRGHAEQVAKYAGHFGMSPSQRARITPSSNQPMLPGMELEKRGGWDDFGKR